MLPSRVVSVSVVLSSASLLSTHVLGWSMFVICLSRSPMMASKFSCGLFRWSTPVQCRPTLVCPMSLPVHVWSRLPWPRTFHPLLVSLVSTFGFGTKANHKSVPSAVPTATVLRTVPSTAVSSLQPARAHGS